MYGFWEYVISTVVITAAYIALMLCLAEMSSILPFGGNFFRFFSSLFSFEHSFHFILGGSYGFARVTIGPYLGFMIGKDD